jgi:hypothetical protein
MRGGHEKLLSFHHRAREREFLDAGCFFYKATKGKRSCGAQFHNVFGASSIDQGSILFTQVCFYSNETPPVRRDHFLTWLQDRP